MSSETSSMRRLAIYALAGALTVICGCKTTEKNMSDAYLTAVAARDSDTYGLDSTVYSQIRREMKHSTITVNGETADVSTQWVKVTEKGGGINESLKRFNVVVGQFKLEFNALSMRERLVDEGYPGAFVVQTREPYFFVITAAYSEVQDAMNAVREVSDDPRLKMKPPCPFILEPAQYAK